MLRRNRNDNSQRRHTEDLYLRALWFEDKPAGKLEVINDSVTEYNVIRLVFALETEFNWLHAHKLGEFNFKIEFDKEYDEIQLRLCRKEK